MHGFENLPGWELVSKGLADLADGRETIESELVSLAAGRLRDRGLALPVDIDPGRVVGERLYSLVAAEVGPRRAHARYNALRRRLVSFLRASAYARIG